MTMRSRVKFLKEFPVNDFLKLKTLQGGDPISTVTKALDNDKGANPFGPEFG